MNNQEPDLITVMVYMSDGEQVPMSFDSGWGDLQHLWSAISRQGGVELSGTFYCAKHIVKIRQAPTGYAYANSIKANLVWN